MTLSALRGRACAVKPERALKFFPPGGIFVTVMMTFADFVLDLNTVNTLLLAGNVCFAGLIVAGSMTSTALEIASGCLPNFPTEVAETIRTGVSTEGFLALLDRERGLEALVSLLVSTYALPFAIRTPLQAGAGGLTIAAS